MVWFVAVFHVGGEVFKHNSTCFLSQIKSEDFVRSHGFVEGGLFLNLSTEFKNPLNLYIPIASYSS